MSKLLDVIDAVHECEKHECSTIAVSTCEKCPSFHGHYENLEGRAAIMCIYPKAVYKCDSLCIHYINKECVTFSVDGNCDHPDKYREVGDVADALKDESL